MEKTFKLIIEDNLVIAKYKKHLDEHIINIVDDRYGIEVISCEEITEEDKDA